MLYFMSNAKIVFRLHST